MSSPTPISIIYSEPITLQIGASYVGNGSTGLIGGCTQNDAVTLEFAKIFAGTDNELFYIVGSSNESDYVGYDPNGNGLVMGMGPAETVYFYKVNNSDNTISIYTADNNNAVINAGGIGLSLGSADNAVHFTIS